MKTLTLVRHAKSSWDDPMLPDHDRPLNDRGRRDAPTMGRRLCERGFTADVILSSSAVRARATAEAIAVELGYELEAIVVLPGLYGASPSTILGVVGELDDSLRSAMVVAHDPGLSELATRLSPGIERMPTAAVAEFTFPIGSWRELPRSRPESVVFETPGPNRG